MAAAHVPADAVTVTFGSFRRPGSTSAIARRIAEARAAGVDLAPFEDAVPRVVRALARGEDPGDVPLPPPSALEPDGWSECRSLGHGVWVWSPLHVRYDDPDRPVVATLDVVVGDDGDPRAIRVEVRARDRDGEVTPIGLRIPLAEVVRVAITKARQAGPEAPRGTRLDAVGQSLPFGGELPKRRTRSTERREDRLRRVAEVHANAPDGRKRAAVAEAFNVAPNTAKNLVLDARKAGYLPPHTGAAE